MPSCRQPSCREYDLDGFAVPDQLDSLHNLLTRVAGDHPEIDPLDIMLFETAVNEIANNVVEYGKPAGEVQWHLKFVVDSDAIKCDLIDTGQPFEVHLSASMPDELAEGGRGLPMAQAILDEVKLMRSQEANHWHMVRRLKAGRA